MNSKYQKSLLHLLYIFISIIIVCSPSYAQLSIEDNNSMVMAQELMQQMDFKGAIKIYDTVIVKNPKYAPAYVQRGLAKSYSGNKLGAIEDYNIAIQQDNKSISALWNRGTEYRLLGKYQESISDFDNALEIDSLYTRSSELYENRGWAKYDAGEYESSITDFTKAIYKNAKSAHSYYLRGKAEQKLGKIDEACEDWKVAKSLGYQFGEQEIQMFCNKNVK